MEEKRDLSNILLSQVASNLSQSSDVVMEVVTKCHDLKSEVAALLEVCVTFNYNRLTFLMYELNGYTV